MELTNQNIDIVEDYSTISTPKDPNYMLRVFLIALGVSTIIFLPFIIVNDGIFLYFSDYNSQQIPFYQLCHDAIRSGEWGFNIFTDLGSDFIGSYSFYTLGSPFFWLTIPFPNDFVPYLMGPLLILKFSLTAVTGYCYVKMFVKNPNSAVIGGLLYAFCGFNMYNIVFNHFQEAVLFFPLLLISMEKFVREDKKYFFALSVALCCIVNYYFFFGQVIFCVIYFFVRINYDDFNIDIKKFLKLALEAVLGLLLTSFLLIPSFMLLMGNDRLGNYIKPENMLIYEDAYRNLVTIINILFPPNIPGDNNVMFYSAYSWSSNSLYIPFFSITGVLSFFYHKKNHFLKPLLTICCVIALIPVLNSAFSAFNAIYYGRWFYMPILMMVLATVMVIDDDFKHLLYGIKLTSIFVVLFIIIGVFPVETFKYGRMWFYFVDNVNLFLEYILISFICLVFLYYLVTIADEKPNLYSITISMVSVLSIVYFIILLNMGYSSTYNLMYNTKEHYLDKSVRVDIDFPTSFDEQFYRIDTHGEFVYNLGMHFKKPVIDCYNSTVSSSIFNYYAALDNQRTVVSIVENDQVGVHAINNVLYRLISADRIDQSMYDDYSNELGFKYIETQYGYAIYQNEYFIPFGVGYDHQVSQNQFDEAEFKDRILVGGVYLGYDENGNEYDILPTITTDLEQSHLSMEQYFINCQTLAQNSIQNLELDSYGFIGVYETDREQILYIPLSYSEGFTAKINGESVEILKANFGFMAVKVQAGINNIEFEYTTPGLKLGFMISFVALILFIFYIYKTKRTTPLEQDILLDESESEKEEVEEKEDEIVEKVEKEDEIVEEVEKET